MLVATVLLQLEVDAATSAEYVSPQSSGTEQDVLLDMQ